MKRATAISACVVVAVVVTWLSTYWISPMHPVLAAPAWAFSRGFAELVELRPGIMRRVSLEQIIALSRVVNFFAWFLACLLVVKLVNRVRQARGSVV